MKTNKKYIKKNYLGFTLVELVVTISILAILGTISIISIQNFYGSARDSVRISDIKSIHQGLSIFQIKSGIYPLPEDSVEIININTVLFYQGYVGENISRIINTDKNPLDPKDTTRYIYAVDKNQKKAQLMGYLESGDTLKTTSYQDIFKNFVNQSYANTNSIDYKNRFIYVEGDKIGVLTDENSAPIQESATGTGLNLSETNSGYVAYFGGDSYGEGKSTGTGDILITQILGAINNTIPCNPITYSGYAISALSHNEMKTFTKPLSIANGSGTGSLQVQCQNGTLDLLHSVDTTHVSCDTGYVNQTNSCIPDICGGTVPAVGAEVLFGTTQTISQNWIHGTGVIGICTFECTTGYTWNSGSLSCIDTTPPTITSVTTSSPACNTVRFTINGANDAIGIHTTPYSFDGGITWQLGNAKDYTSLNQTITANQIKVRDAVGNIYTYASSINGTSSSCAVNCVGSWSNNGTCSASCGGGVIQQTYTITTPAANGGTACPSTNGATQWGGTSCNTQACPVNGSCNNATNFSCSAGTSASNVAGSCGGSATWSCNGLNGGSNASCSKTNVACPVNCVGSWSNNGTCSASCGGGVIQQTYTITTPAANGGTACPSTNGATQWGGTSCNAQSCCAANMGTACVKSNWTGGCYPDYSFPSPNAPPAGASGCSCTHAGCSPTSAMCSCTIYGTVACNGTCQ